MNIFIHQEKSGSNNKKGKQTNKRYIEDITNCIIQHTTSLPNLTYFV